MAIGRSGVLWLLRLLVSLSVVRCKYVCHVQHSTCCRYSATSLIQPYSLVHRQTHYDALFLTSKTKTKKTVYFCSRYFTGLLYSSNIFFAMSINTPLTLRTQVVCEQIGVAHVEFCRHDMPPSLTHRHAGVPFDLTL